MRLQKARMTEPTLNRHHARRLRDVYRSAGWPWQDALELELLAAGMLERVMGQGSVATVRITDEGVAFLAAAFAGNRQARSAHEDLVTRVANMLVQGGRLAWTGLSIRAELAPDANAAGVDMQAKPLDWPQDAPNEPDLAGPPSSGQHRRWRLCMPDVFSIRHTSVRQYLQPVVHEIKVSRADLVGDLAHPDKRAAYLNLGGQCWYVLGMNKKGQPIGSADEVPQECGVLMAHAKHFEIARPAPARLVSDLPFSVWMALARATPVPSARALAGEAGEQIQLLADGASTPPLDRW